MKFCNRQKNLVEPLENASCIKWISQVNYLYTKRESGEDNGKSDGKNDDDDNGESGDDNDDDDEDGERLRRRPTEIYGIRTLRRCLR